MKSLVLGGAGRYGPAVLAVLALLAGGCSRREALELARLIAGYLRPRPRSGPGRIILDGDLLERLKSLGYFLP